MIEIDGCAENEALKETKSPAVYIINGVGESGKSTFVSILSELYPLIKEISTVDKVKEVAEFAG